MKICVIFFLNNSVELKVIKLLHSKQYKLKAFVMSVDLTDKQDQKCIIFCDKLWYHWFHIIWEQNGANWVAQILRKF